MLPDFGRYYGAAFTYIIDRWQRAVSFEKLEVGAQGFYIVDDKVPLFIKFSRNRKSPWSFTFQRDHILQYRGLVSSYGDCIVCLVCGSDGIAALIGDQMNELLNRDLKDQDGLSVRRKLNHMYSVTGANGQLSGKVARDSLAVLLAKLLDSSAN